MTDTDHFVSQPITGLLCIRERTAEVEREIERQRVLEVERAKTRELRHNLDLEKEKQTQANYTFFIQPMSVIVLYQI